MVRTADCVVAGYRVHKSGDGAIGSLLLGLDIGPPTSRATAHHVERRLSLERRQRPLIRPAAARRVVEVRYDHMEGQRFHHTAQFNRWRPDRDPSSCTYVQLEHPVTFSLGDIVPGLVLGDA